jgi:hypothetical protein
VPQIFQRVAILEFLRQVGHQATDRHIRESSDFREVGVCAKGQHMAAGPSPPGPGSPFLLLPKHPLQQEILVAWRLS